MSQDCTTSNGNTATIVGAGLGGLMMAIRLARRGYHVDLYERRQSVAELSEKQRSFTLTISARGLAALAEIDLRDEALALSVGLGGRMIHGLNGTTTYVPYSKDPSEQLHAIRRHDMNALLYQAACRYPTIRCHFHQRLVQLDKAQGQLLFQDERAAGDDSAAVLMAEKAAAENGLYAVTSSLIIGCDGLFSTVRQQTQRGMRADYQQDCLDWGYKDVLIPAGPSNEAVMATNALHLWPRGGCTFFAFPTIDGAFAANFIAPFTLMSALTTVDDVFALLEQEFPDLLAVAPSLPLQLAAAPLSHFVTTKTAPWSYEDKIVMLGDAVHGVTPFWGEGMNAAFEDSALLDRLLAEHPTDRATAFAHFEAVRKPNTDLLADLAKENFLELRNGSGTLHVMARKWVERMLYHVFPRWWLPLNIMISHRCISYQEAHAQYTQQRRWARLLGIDLVILLVMAILWLRERLGKMRTPLAEPPKKGPYGYGKHSPLFGAGGKQ